MRARRDDNDEFREDIPSEIEDSDSSPVSFEVVTYPADYTLLGLYEKLASQEIVVPKFQRKFVWKQKQSSRLIESFLLGLPVPPIFLFTRRDGKQWVVDGQQRLKSIAYFFSGFFGEPGDARDEFKLILDSKSPYHDKSYADLKAHDKAAFRILNNTVLRSFVIKQINPQDNSSVFHIFERLNTGGTSLVGQEIRNCICHGPFNDLLIRLNDPPSKRSKLPEEWEESVRRWREILGKAKADPRQRDVELILRFFALHDAISSYAKPMKDFLNNYMEKMRDCNNKEIERHSKLFQDTVDAVHSRLGEKPFHIHAGLNAAVYDSVFVAFASNLGDIPSDIKSRFKRLKSDAKYIQYVMASTTDEAVVRNRILRAKKVMFGK